MAKQTIESSESLRVHYNSVGGGMHTKLDCNPQIKDEEEQQVGCIMMGSTSMWAEHGAACWQHPITARVLFVLEFVKP